MEASRHWLDGHRQCGQAAGRAPSWGLEAGAWGTLTEPSRQPSGWLVPTLLPGERGRPEGRTHEKKISKVIAVQHTVKLCACAGTHTRARTHTHTHTHTSCVFFTTLRVAPV